MLTYGYKHSYEKWKHISSSLHICHHELVTTLCCCSIYIPKVKFWLLQIKSADQIWSLKKHWMKISYNKKVSSLDEKKLNNKNASLRIQISFDWMKIYFGIT